MKKSNYFVAVEYIETEARINQNGKKVWATKRIHSDSFSIPENKIGYSRREIETCLNILLDRYNTETNKFHLSKFIIVSIYGKSLKNIEFMEIFQEHL